METAVRRIHEITDSRVEVGQIYTGHVTRIVDFGAFVNILPGKDGLVHISQITGTKIKDVSEYLSVGDEVRVKVMNIDSKNRIALSIKAAKDDEEGTAEAPETTAPGTPAPESEAQKVAPESAEAAAPRLRPLPGRSPRSLRPQPRLQRHLRKLPQQTQRSRSLLPRQPFTASPPQPPRRRPQRRQLPQSLPQQRLRPLLLLMKLPQSLPQSRLLRSLLRGQGVRSPQRRLRLTQSLRQSALLRRRLPQRLLPRQRLRLSLPQMVRLQASRRSAPYAAALPHAARRGRQTRAMQSPVREEERQGPARRMPHLRQKAQSKL